MKGLFTILNMRAGAKGAARRTAKNNLKMDIDLLKHTITNSPLGWEETEHLLTTLERVENNLKWF